ncbi:MAG: hypothetical protein ACPGVL_09265 [Pseudoalteromonas spongiae]|uniref:Phage shock protein B n=1 Tax=Pseudoalteromonas spongiae TaxID=298657 RepID=A0ABU8ERZ2_9GAMM|nr:MULTISPECIES: hypothetical protein [Pseudoalteromonas]KPV94964.1 hypothetical protein AN214_02999 [Pseudoalteromonas sp. P1-9]MCF6456246.1 hypothetical protein [Pseudoalteromonas sp. MMG024]MEC8325290.1 hypothetical protein [Pseudomonadota bacterium]TMO87826.1 hypothetical protein CWC15_03150 [Pseudoalteromonas spongiae]
MSGTTMIVMIVFVSVGFGVLADMYNKHIKFKEKTLKHNQASDAQTEDLKQQITKLTERVQVLEKIVTDDGYQVAKEINKL